MNNFDEELIAFARASGNFETSEFRDMMSGKMLEKLTFENEELRIFSDSLSYSISKMNKWLKPPYMPTDEGLDMFDRYCKLRCKINDYLGAQNEHTNRMSTQKETIGHYDKMIEWAEKQHGDEKPTSTKMRNELDITWFTDDCPYCKVYRRGLDCGDCPLFIGKEEFEFVCCDGLWREMDDSKTWKIWVRRARAVRQYVIDYGGTG